MKVLLKIEHRTFLLPNDRGLAAVIKTLASALEVKDRRYYKEGIHVDTGETVSVEIAYIAPGTKIHWPKSVSDPEPEMLRLRAPKSIILDTGE
jgi:hypothetical protein